MDDTFRSKSSRIVASKIKDSPITYTEKAPLSKDTILWCGELNEVSEYGVNFRYRMIDSIEDNSSILQLYALILNDVNLNSYIKMINFAINYDIPVVWLHSHLVPHDWMWSFKLCYVGKLDVLDFWRHVCELRG